jgi:hypothetical protein
MRCLSEPKKNSRTTLTSQAFRKLLKPGFKFAMRSKTNFNRTAKGWVSGLKLLSWKTSLFKTVHSSTICRLTTVKHWTAGSNFAKSNAKKK